MKTLHKSNQFVRSPCSRHLSGTKAEEITRAIVNMVVQDYMPLRIVGRWVPCIIHKCGKTSIDTSNRVLDRKKYRLTG